MSNPQIFTLNDLHHVRDDKYTGTHPDFLELYKNAINNHDVNLDFLVKFPIDESDQSFEIEPIDGSMIDQIQSIKLPKMCSRVTITVNAVDGEWNVDSKHYLTVNATDRGYKIENEETHNHFTSRLGIVPILYTLENTDKIVFNTPIPLCSLPYLKSIRISFEKDDEIHEVVAECSIFIDTDVRKELMNKSPYKYSFLPGSDQLWVNGGNIITI
jgi:hypothetical protein